MTEGGGDNGDGGCGRPGGPGMGVRRRAARRSLFAAVAAAAVLGLVRAAAGATAAGPGVAATGAFGCGHPAVRVTAEAAGGGAAALPSVGRQAAEGGAAAAAASAAGTPTPTATPSPADIVRAVVAGCTLTSSAPDTVVLLQVNGSVEHLLSATLTLPHPGLPLTDIAFGVTSTNGAVLQAPTADGDAAAVAAASAAMLSRRVSAVFPNGNARVVNVTLAADFDAMVGTTNVSLVATTLEPADDATGGGRVKPPTEGRGEGDGGTVLTLGTATCSYIIAGISVYQTASDGSPTLVSGDGHGLSIPYTALLPTGATGAASDATAAPNKFSLSVFVQFANGTSSAIPASVASGPTAGAESVAAFMGGVDASLVSWSGQLAHNAASCSMTSAASADAAAPGGFRLADGCGFGFYHTATGGVQLGLGVEPYRAGPLVIGLAWSALTATDVDLMDEVWTSIVTIDITGRPPPVIMGVAPWTDELGAAGALAAGDFASAPTMLRPSGGEQLVYQAFNCEGSVERAVAVTLGGDGAQSAVGGNLSSGGGSGSGGNDGGGRRVTFLEVPGSYLSTGAPAFMQYFTVTTVPGNGTGLPWQLLVTRPSVGADGGSGPLETVTAVMSPGLDAPLSYDTRLVAIDNMSPTGGTDTGGATITLSGYFPGLQLGRGDGVFFNAVRVPDRYIVSVTASVITFTLPPLSTFGRNTDYTVTVHVAAEVSNGLAFGFWSGSTVAQMEVTGTSTRGDAYELGRCNTARFTVMLQPLSAATTTFKWTVRARVAGGTDLLTTLPADRATRDTLVLTSDEVPLGDYTVSVTVTLPTFTVSSSSHLRRTDALSVGVYLHTPPVRAVTVPDAPLRVAALIDTPGCFTPPVSGNDSLILKWSFMGRTTQWSYRETEARAQASSSEETPARLGWEYVVPQPDLEYGRHPVALHVSYAGASEVHGTASTVVEVAPSPLVARIRNGETVVNVNTKSALTMVGNRSVDPDVVAPANGNAGLTYAWSCVTAEAATDDPFQPSTVEGGSRSSPARDACPLALLPATDASSAWTVPPSAFAGLPGKVSHVYYRLVVRKSAANAADAVLGTRTSAPTTLTVRVARDEAMPALTNFLLDVRDKRGVAIDPAAVKYFDDVVLHVATDTPGTTWSYSLVSPLTDVATFLAPSRLLVEHGYYRPDALGTLGNRLPLGIRAGSLAPSTAYEVRVDLEAAGYAAKSASLTLQTLERPSVVFPTPAIMEGDTGTEFSAWAGPSFNDSSFVIYFKLTNEAGETTCVGGCTGYPLVRFRVGLPGTYKLTAVLYDAQGAAELDVKTLDTPLVVTEAPDVQDRLRADLLRSFRRGDDASWTGLAKDVAFMLSTEFDQPHALTAVRRMAVAHAAAEVAALPSGDLAVIGTRQQLEANSTALVAADDTVPTVEGDGSTTTPAAAATAAAGSDADLKTFVSDTVYEIIHGGNRLFCNSVPNTLHSEVCMALVNTLAMQQCLSAEAVYSLGATVRCCAENVPLRTAGKMDGLLATAFDNLARLAANADCAEGSGRRRLRSEAGAPSQIVPDIYEFIVAQTTSIVGVDKAAGFATRIRIEPEAPARRSAPTMLVAGIVSGDAAVRVNSTDQGVPTDGALTTFRQQEAATPAAAELHHGVLSLAVASNPEQLPSLGVYGRDSGTSRTREEANAEAADGGGPPDAGELVELKGLRGDGENNYFFMRPVCLERVFGTTGTKRLLFAYYQSPDFVVQSGIQEAPHYAETTPGLFTTRIYEEDTSTETTGKLRPLAVADDGPHCFCWRLPLANVSAFDGTDDELRPGVYTFTELKEYGVDVAKGEAFHYWEDTVLLVGSSISERWVEACMDRPGLIGAAPTTRIIGPLGFGTTVLAGFQSLTVAGIIVGVIVAVVVALVASWMVATRTATGGALPPRGIGAGEVFVERDVWGRGTGLAAAGGDVTPAVSPVAAQ
ncbi:hypothetical protein BU14_0356s0009 [Porphyra umbilicalis]|uniref:PKD/REJ-like domain-containing protein n=1 Tax=Porphyra umbilicalis TaxID=2786 RepID=A0A1X6NY91_PORUM|nr:hypothetical protein BU14_0356s0009 [Porphyra umbilicalis]|eukprot:OSX73343.1 hypothetical protein BU14_0356s0009 [Porphyra umbilicalis]